MPDAPSRPSNPKIAALEEEIAQLEAQLRYTPFPSL